MKTCPDCDPSGLKAQTLAAYRPIITNGMAFYANPCTPEWAVKTHAELLRAFCRKCAWELGLAPAR